VHRANPADLRFAGLAPPAFAPALLSPRQVELVDTLRNQLSLAGNTAEVLEALFDGLSSITPCRRVDLFLPDDEGARLTLHRLRAAEDTLELLAGWEQPMAGSLFAELIAPARCALIPDLARFVGQRPRETFARLLHEEGRASGLFIPLVLREQLIGVLGCSAAERDAFDVESLRLFRELLPSLAQSVRTGVQIERLEAANHAYMEMLGFVSHELKNPVAAIVTDTRVLLEGYLGELSEAQTKQLHKVTRKGEYLLELIKKYLDLARIEDGALQPKLRSGVDFLAEVVSPAFEMVHSALDEAGMELTTFFPETAIGAQCDVSLLRIVMLNLLDNAIKYGRPRGELRVHVSRVEGKLSVTVWNEGSGFSPDERTRLFQRFSRLSKPVFAGKRGSGVGLYSSWRIVRLHNGTMKARSSEGEWAEFSFEIPQPVGPLRLRSGR